MFFKTVRSALGLALLFICFNKQVWAVNNVCSEIGGKARFLGPPHNSCVCVSPPNQGLPGTDCPTDPNGQPGCTGSCGIDCYEGSGGTCYIQCNPGYTNVAGVCINPTCNTGSICTVDTSVPAFKFAYPTCQPGGTGCDYGCSKGQKGCGGKPGCYSSCLGGTGIPQTKRRRDALNAARERIKRIADAVASGPLPSGGGVFRDKDICPILGHMACFVPGATTRDAFECIDPLADLTSCGGCVAQGGLGVDCSKLEGVQGVQCVKGTCKIGSCKPRYRLIRGSDGQATCVRN